MLTTFSGRPTSQNENELNALVRFMSGRGCESYLEVGARHGDTFHHVCMALGDTSRGVAVDLPGAAWGVASSMKSLAKAVDDIRWHGHVAHIVVGDSHDAGVVERVRGLGPYDLALIDADHRYEAVAQDFRDYAPMARYVAFHDIVGHTQGTTRDGYRMDVEVPRFWAEVKDGRESWEFVDEGSLMGIGVIKTSRRVQK